MHYKVKNETCSVTFSCGEGWGVIGVVMVGHGEGGNG